MANYHLTAKSIGRSSRNTVAAVAYRTGTELVNMRTGEVSNYADKDVGHVELIGPDHMAEWGTSLQAQIAHNRTAGVQAFVEMMERAEKRIDAQVYREVEFSLPNELTQSQNIALAREFLKDQCAQRGMLVLASFHFDKDEETGISKPHCHALLSLREVEKAGLSRYKNRDWNSKAFLEDLREQWAAYQNFHLAQHGHSARVDHRSYKEQGLDLEPQPKMGRNIQEMEARSPYSSAVTDKGKEFSLQRLRNLYRIVRNPDMVLALATRRSATFTWKDVQTILHRYVDDPVLFQKLESTLKRSQGLLAIDINDGSHQRYTTKGILATEHSLLQRVKDMSEVSSHAISAPTIKYSMSYGNDLLAKHGGLSSEQIAAVQGILADRQVTSLIGYAGTGKTTCLQVATHAWETEGYQVVGLAPTGRARDNIQALGISAYTLASFLHNYDQGRMQFREKTVLVLDEAGMVGLQDLDRVTTATQKLGVKLVLVGDTGQLKPIAAGDPYRLITKILPTSRIESVVRQHEVWQREASVLFGRGETYKALTMYNQHGNITRGDKEDLLREWHAHVEAHEISRTAILAHTREDIRLLNADARVLRREAGHLTGGDHFIPIARAHEDEWGRVTTHEELRAFAVGERVIFTQNNRYLAVSNGMFGTITHLKGTDITVTLDGEEPREVSFSTNLFKGFDQGYAVTIHRTQGVTVDQSFIYPSPYMDKNLSYVALTRHKQNTRVYLDPERFEDNESALRVLSQERAKEAAHDHVAASSVEGLIQDDTTYLEKFATRMGHELHALGVVSKEIFNHVWEQFMAGPSSDDRDEKLRYSVYGDGYETNDGTKRAEAATRSDTLESQADALRVGSEHQDQARSMGTDQGHVHKELTPSEITTHIENLDKLYARLDTLDAAHADHQKVLHDFKESAWKLLNCEDGVQALQDHDLSLCRVARHETRDLHHDYISSEHYMSLDAATQKHIDDAHHPSHASLKECAYNLMKHEASSEDLMNHNFDVWNRARSLAKEYAQEHNINEHTHDMERQRSHDHGLEI